MDPGRRPPTRPLRKPRCVVEGGARRRLRRRHHRPPPGWRGSPPWSPRRTATASRSRLVERMNRPPATPAQTDPRRAQRGDSRGGTSRRPTTTRWAERGRSPAPDDLLCRIRPPLADRPNRGREVRGDVAGRELDRLETCLVCDRSGIDGWLRPVTRPRAGEAQAGDGLPRRSSPRRDRPSQLRSRSPGGRGRAPAATPKGWDPRTRSAPGHAGRAGASEANKPQNLTSVVAFRHHAPTLFQSTTESFPWCTMRRLFLAVTVALFMGVRADAAFTFTLAQVGSDVVAHGERVPEHDRAGFRRPDRHTFHD